MAINLKQNQDASAGLQGTDADDGAFLMRDFQYIATTAAANTVFVAPRRMILKSINVRPDVAGTDAGAVTAAVYRAPSGTAISASPSSPAPSPSSPRSFPLVSPL